MKLLTSAVVLIFVLSASNLDHPFHVSICEINHNAAKQRVEIIHKIFWDDLEEGLEKMTGKYVNVSSPADPEELQKLIAEYIGKRVSISLDGKKREVIFIGSELEEDAMWCYMEIENISSFQSIEIQNGILMEIFDDQMNLIHVENKGKLKSLRFNQRKFVDSLTF
jgi:hypothetical protein